MTCSVSTAIKFYSFIIVIEKVKIPFPRLFCSYRLDANWLLLIRCRNNRLQRQPGGRGHLTLPFAAVISKDDTEFFAPGFGSWVLGSPG